jgi:hypothetical protein
LGSKTAQPGEQLKASQQPCCDQAKLIYQASAKKEAIAPVPNLKRQSQKIAPKADDLRAINSETTSENESGPSAFSPGQDADSEPLPLPKSKIENQKSKITLWGNHLPSLSH